VVVYVASSRTSRGVQGEDGRVDAIGYVRPFYLNFIIFNVLGSRGIVVI
jgi:hypothetical protein